MNMSVVLNKEEKLLKETPASFCQGAAFISGKLFLSDQRLIFEPYKSEQELELIIIERSQIVAIEKSTPKIEVGMPISKEAIKLFIKDKSDYEFSLLGRDAWFALIDSKIKK